LGQVFGRGPEYNARERQGSGIDPGFETRHDEAHR